MHTIFGIVFLFLLTQYLIHVPEHLWVKPFITLELFRLTPVTRYLFLLLLTFPTYHTAYNRLSNDTHRDFQDFQALSLNSNFNLTTQWLYEHHTVVIYEMIQFFQHPLDLQPSSQGGAGPRTAFPPSSLAITSGFSPMFLQPTIGLEGSLASRHRRCSSPGSFLHMIREDVIDSTITGEDWSVLGNIGGRKTSFGFDDLSPVCDWSRKTSSTSGFSEMTDSSMSRKLSYASEEEKLSIYSSYSRKTSAASEEGDQMEKILGALERRSKSISFSGFPGSGDDMATIQGGEEFQAGIGVSSVASVRVHSNVPTCDSQGRLRRQGLSTFPIKSELDLLSRAWVDLGRVFIFHSFCSNYIHCPTRFWKI